MHAIAVIYKVLGGFWNNILGGGTSYTPSTPTILGSRCHVISYQGFPKRAGSPRGSWLPGGTGLPVAISQK